MYMQQQYVHNTFLNSEETTQLRRMATWEKGLTTEPRTRDLRPNAEFQPRELRNQSHSFVPHRPLCARVRGSVVGPFSHVAILLSCVVSSEFKQLVPAHKEHIYTIPSSHPVCPLPPHSTSASLMLVAWILSFCSQWHTYDQHQRTRKVLNWFHSSRGWNIRA